MNVQSVVKGTGRFFKKNSSKILLGFGISGGVTACVLAVKATPKAIELIQKKKEELDLEPEDTLDTKEVILTVWKCYIPAFVIGGMSILCVIASHSSEVRRNAAIASAYTISESTFRNYRNKVMDIVGEEKEKEVRDAVVKDQLNKNPVSNTEVYMTQKGNTLIFEPISGRYFRGDFDKVFRAINEINHEILRNSDPFSNGYATLNDFYILIGLPETSMGDTLGWRMDMGMIEVKPSAQIADNGEPCLAIVYTQEPVYDFDR